MSELRHAPAAALIGRDRELALLTAGAGQLPRRCVVAEPGAGKSALLAAAADVLSGAGVRVVRCAPTPAESELAYAAIADLLAGFSEWEALGDITARTLRIVLFGEPDGILDPPDARRAGQACIAAWTSGSARTVLVVDDVQWLDAASAAVLTFVARRLPDDLGILAARRADADGPTLPLEPLALDSLDDASLLRLVTGRGDGRGAALSAPVARRVVAASGGNPLFAIELARAATTAGHDGSLVVPNSLDALIAERFGAVTADTVQALASVALLAVADLATVARLGIADAVDQAEADGLVDTATGRVRFTHPLFSAAMVARLTPGRRRRIHARLASVVTDPVDAAVHAARATTEPDAGTAARLMDAARHVASRGAIDNAAALAELAVRLTPQDDAERSSRIVSAAELAFQAGDTDGARRLLDGFVGDGLGHVMTDVRCAEKLVRAKVEFSAGSIHDALRCAQEALDIAPTDLARIEAFSILARVNYEDFASAAECAERAYELTTGVDVPSPVMASVLVAVATGRLMTGQGLHRPLWERVIELERPLDVYAPESAEAAFAALLKITDELDEARDRLLDLLARTSDDGALPFVLSHLPQLELWSGNWDRAEDYAHRHLDAAVRSGQTDQASQARTNLALIDVHRGTLHAAKELAERIRDDAVARGDAWAERSGQGLLGLIAMADGDAERAVAHFGRWHDLAEQMALREPGYCRFQADYVEAMIATGRLAEAAGYVAMMRDRAAVLQRPTAMAIAARVDALLLAASGEREAAVDRARAAVDLLAGSPLVVEHARALMSLGQIHRRFKEKAAARAALEAALATFERLGADRFAARARQDLERVGGRHAGPVTLTETERRVVALAAAGRTVRQIGDELFISPKTVEANLTRVYRKLGLSNRAELTAWSLRAGGARDD